MAFRWIRRLLVLLVIVAAAIAVRYTFLRSVPVPVTVFKVAPGRVEDTVTNSRAGTIKSRRRASLSPELGGRVAALPVRKGDRVRKGQVLLRLVDDEYVAQVRLQQRSADTARATADEARETIRLAKLELGRVKELVASGIAAAQQLDELQSRYDSALAATAAAEARIRQAEAALEAARVSVGKTVIHAPFDAVVAEVTAEVGEWITPSPPGLPIPPVIELIDTDAIYVSAPLDEVDVGKVRTGLPVRITLDAYSGRSFTGRLLRIASFVSDVQEQNRTFEVEVEFDDQRFARTLLPGTSADVEVILSARDNVLRIPGYALMQGSKVMRVRRLDQVLEAVPVATGLSNWEFVEIASGLSPGDLVVVSLDRVDVREGVEVRIEGETLH